MPELRFSTPEPKGTSIDNLAMEVQEQADRLFPDRTDDSMYKKLFSEIGELVESGTADEWADVMIMLLDFGGRKGWSLESAIRMKMLINERRVWAKTQSGVMRHVS